MGVPIHKKALRGLRDALRNEDFAPLSTWYHNWGFFLGFIVAAYAVSVVRSEHRSEDAAGAAVVTLIFLGVLGYWYVIAPIYRTHLHTWSAEQRRRRLEIDAHFRSHARKVCRNCSSEFANQNPGGGMFKCSVCGQSSRKPKMVLPQEQQQQQQPSSPSLSQPSPHDGASSEGVPKDSSRSHKVTPTDQAAAEKDRELAKARAAEKKAREREERAKREAEEEEERRELQRMIDERRRAAEAERAEEQRREAERARDIASAAAISAAAISAAAAAAAKEKSAKIASKDKSVSPTGTAALKSESSLSSIMKLIVVTEGHY